MRTVLLLLTCLGLCSVSQAEYRVFTLLKVNTKTQNRQQIQTTLDHEQFKDFYPLGPDEYITYVESWRCKGRTDFYKPHCENPSQNTVSNKASKQN